MKLIDAYSRQVQFARAFDRIAAVQGRLWLAIFLILAANIAAAAALRFWPAARAAAGLEAAVDAVAPPAPQPETPAAAEMPTLPELTTPPAALEAPPAEGDVIPDAPAATPALPEAPAAPDALTAPDASALPALPAPDAAAAVLETPTTPTTPATPAAPALAEAAGEAGAALAGAAQDASVPGIDPAMPLDALEAALPVDPTAGAAPATPAAPAAAPAQSDDSAAELETDFSVLFVAGLRILLPIFRVAALVCAALLAATLSLALKLSLLGRLGGADRLTAALIWAMMLIVVTVPWSSAFAGFPLPAATLMPDELFNLTDSAMAGFVDWTGALLYWARAAGYPALALVLCLAVKVQWLLARRPIEDSLPQTDHEDEERPAEAH